MDVSRCTNCGRCLDACPNQAIEKRDDRIHLIRHLCQGCGACVPVCPNEARQLVGRQTEIEAVFKEVEKDRLFYKNSGGGVTLSGGEPMSQPDFVQSLLKICKENGIHTVLDSCGYTPLSIWDRVLDYVDMILFDLKQLDTAKHESYTGVSNERILASAKKLSSLGIPMVIRIPFIPGYTDSHKNMEDTAWFAKEIGVHRIELLPFHSLCINKYHKLDKEWKLNGISPPTKSSLEEARDRFHAHGQNCTF